MRHEPTPFMLACQAVSRSRCLELTYGGHQRLVEVHVAGFTADGEPLLRVWQVRGGSRSGEPIGWKMFHLDRVEAAAIGVEHSEAPRQGYRRDDPVIRRIMRQV